MVRGTHPMHHGHGSHPTVHPTSHAHGVHHSTLHDHGVHHPTLHAHGVHHPAIHGHHGSHPRPHGHGPHLGRSTAGNKRNYLGNYPRQLIAIVPPGACSSHPLPESPVQPQELQGALPALPQEEAEEQGGDAGHRRHQVVLVDVAVVHEARRRGRKHGPVPVLLSLFPVHRVVVVPAPMMTWHLVTLAHHAHVHVHVHAALVGHGHPHHAGMVGFDVCSSAKKCQRRKSKGEPGVKITFFPLFLRLTKQKILPLGHPNEPECADFASILRHLLLRAISTQPCYVSCASRLRSL